MAERRVEQQQEARPQQDERGAGCPCDVCQAQVEEVLDRWNLHFMYCTHCNFNPLDLCPTGEALCTKAEEVLLLCT